jgi:hypothetical protein
MRYVYAFDVDHTLEISDGPIPLAALETLAHQGHIVGLCGNFAMVTMQWAYWPRIISFLGPMAMTKVVFLRQVKTYIPASDYIMVGNDPLILSPRGNVAISNDRVAAEASGFRFLSEQEFAEGQR